MEHQMFQMEQKVFHIDLGSYSEIIGILTIIFEKKKIILTDYYHCQCELQIILLEVK